MIKQSLPTIDLIQIVSKMYVSNSGRFTRTALYNLLKHTTDATIDECVEYYTEMDLQRHGNVTLGKHEYVNEIKTNTQCHKYK